MVAECGCCTTFLHATTAAGSLFERSRSGNVTTAQSSPVLALSRVWRRGRRRRGSCGPLVDERDACRPPSSRWRASTGTTDAAGGGGQRVALLVQYDGSSFSGWEKKPDAATIQGHLEDAIAGCLGQPVATYGASRTDAGAHAAGQVLHFDVPPELNPDRNWSSVLNQRLDASVRVLASQRTHGAFHARHSALSRHYRYSILTDPRPNAFLQRFAWHVYRDSLDVDRMAAAAEALVTAGGHDLDMSAFRKSDCGSSVPFVTIHRIHVQRRSQHLVEIDICADRYRSKGEHSFLYGMIRLLTATLVEVGRGVLAVDGFRSLVRSQDRGSVRHSAPACGLCLMQVQYPVELRPFSSRVLDGQPLGLSPLSLPLDELRT